MIKRKRDFSQIAFAASDCLVLFAWTALALSIIGDLWGWW